MKKEITTVCVLFALVAAAAYGQTAQTRLDNGKRLFDQGNGNIVAAIQELNEAIRLDPNMAEAYAYRSWANRNNNNEQALVDANKAIQLNPQLGMGYFARGRWYSLKGDHDRAIADYTQAIRLDPNFASAYKERGFVYHYDKDDYDRAIADYTQMIRLDPNDSFAYSLRGSVYKEKKDYDRAIADYIQAIRLDPNNSFAYSLRGSVYKEKKDYDRAIADYTQVIRLDPNDAYYYYLRGEAYENKGDYGLAIADYEAALRIKPDSFLAKSALERYRPEQKDVLSVISIDSEKLFEEYRANALKADTQYKGKTLSVTGSVVRVQKDSNNQYYVALKGRSVMYVKIYFKASEVSKLANLTIGQRITVVGTCNGSEYNEVFIRNSIIQN